jgi:hypothetical protein
MIRRGVSGAVVICSANGTARSAVTVPTAAYCSPSRVPAHRGAATMSTAAITEAPPPSTAI